MRVSLHSTGGVSVTDVHVASSRNPFGATWESLRLSLGLLTLRITSGPSRAFGCLGLMSDKGLLPHAVLRPFESDDPNFTSSLILAASVDRLTRAYFTFICSYGR